MTTPEPPDNQPLDPQPPVPPESSRPLEPPADPRPTPPPSPYGTSGPAEPVAPAGYPADNIPSPFDSEPESNRAPIIAGVVTAALVLIGLGIFIYSNQPDPVASPPTTEPRPVTTLSSSTTPTTPLDVTATYTALSVFFNFGTDGNTAGEKTYLWDDVEFGVPLPDTTDPMLTDVSIASSNANPALATRFASMRRVTERHLAISQISFALLDHLANQ